MTTCPSCASENPDTQKFCGECGARLTAVAAAETASSPATSYTPRHLAEKILASRAALEGERKLVTVMFCDIANSTPLAGRLGAEAMHALLNRFFELALAEVHRYEGTINQFLGDGFMALFGAPVAHEDHVRRALLAACGIRDRLRDSPDERLRQLRIRMGTNTGMVVVGSIGDNLRMDYTAVGDTTNLAARLQSHAEPGAIRASEATHRAGLQYFEFRALGKHALKGIAAPTAIYDVVGVRVAAKGSPEGEAATLDVPIVGRERELAVLDASLAALRAGRGEVVVLRGEPGVGKSRLIAEARSRPGAERLRWLEGRALSFGRHLSYWPFIEILKACLAIENTDTEAQAWRKLEEAARGLFGDRAPEIVPYLATVLSLEMSGEYEQRVKFLDAQALGRQVFLTMRQLLEELARRQPTLLVMEDWHWVDHSSVALCEHLIPVASAHPVAFWFVTRADPREPAARIRDVAESRDVGVPFQEIALVPLGEAQSLTLIESLVGQLPEAVRGQIVRRTEGNPFFIEEVVRALIADGTLVRAPGDGAWRLARPVAGLVLPETIQAVIAARIDRLEEGVKTVLKLASVIGRSFFLRILEAVAEAGDRVDAALGQLEHAELIRMRQQLPELEYIFKHALVQEAAYASILVERRRGIHRSVAEALERLFADRLDEFTSVLAYHWALAEDWEKAQEYLFKAGDQAGRMAADAEALEHYRQAEAVYRKVAARELTPFQRAALDRKLGQAFYGVGNYEQAVEHLTRALGHLGIQYPRTRGGVRWSLVKYLAAHFARRLVPGGDHALRRRPMDLPTAQEISTICRSLAWLDYFADEERFGLDSLIELYAGERSGDVLARVRGLGTLSLLLRMLGASRMARRRLDEASAIANGGGDPAAVPMGALIRGWQEFVEGSVDDSLRSLRLAASAFHGIGDIRGWGGPSTLMCTLLHRRADLAALEVHSAEMVRIGRGAGDPHIVSWGQNGLGLHAFTAGPLDEAAAHLSAAVDLTGRISSFRMRAGCGGLLGRCQLRQGRVAEAAATLEQSLALIEAKNFRGEWSSDPLNGFAELCLIDAERRSGAARRDAMRTAARACDRALATTRKAPLWLPETWRLHGILAWLSGDPAAARQRWAKGLAVAADVGLPVERARTLLTMGHRLGDAALVDEATGVFEQTGARVDLAFALHARAELALAAGDDAGAALRRLDQAVAALDEVKAELALGLACRQRARLHAQLGRPDQASADLATARRCFAAVGAPDVLDAEGEVRS
jgi:class 3 adenylate cyclase/tetratricopeptide (TPR) repeat protein